MEKGSKETLDLERKFRVVRILGEAMADCDFFLLLLPYSSFSVSINGRRPVTTSSPSPHSYVS